MQTSVRTWSNQKNKSNIHTIASYTLCKAYDIDKSLLKNPMILRYLERKMFPVWNPISWNPDAITLSFLKRNKRKFFEVKAWRFGDIVNEINSIAYTKFKAKAYLHWYYKYGLMEEDFENCFNIIDNLIESYSEAIY